MKVGVLTGGGDCPGLNPAIRGAVMRLLDFDTEIVGFTHGWKGLVEGLTTPLTLEAVESVISDGGTMLRSSRINPFKAGNEAQLAAVLDNLKRHHIDALIAIGGNDTLGVAAKLYHVHGINTVGVPKTMDNDLKLTDFTFGFDTAAGTAMEAIDRLRDTAIALERVIVVEVMGRHAGWVALYSAVATGADWVLIPEVEPDIDAMCAHLLHLKDRGKNWSLVVVSEGVTIPGERDKEAEIDAFGHKFLKDSAVGPTLASEINRRTGLPVREVVLGHIVRGGSPSVFDRILGTRVGIKAADLVMEGNFGKMVALQGGEVISVPISDAIHGEKMVPRDLYDSLVTTFNK